MNELCSSAGGQLFTFHLLFRTFFNLFVFHGQHNSKHLNRRLTKIMSAGCFGSFLTEYKNDSHLACAIYLSGGSCLGSTETM